MISLFGKSLYVYYLIDENENILAYSLHFNEKLGYYHLKKIQNFHKLQGKIIKDNKLDKKLQETLRKVIYENYKPKIFLEEYKYYKVYEILLNTEAKTITYGKLSKLTNLHIRTVVTTLKHNPFLIIIPCHKVIRSNGDLGNYTPLGKEFKKILLREQCKLTFQSK